MDKNSTQTNERPKLLHWTRAGFEEGSWGSYETFESLVFSQTLGDQVQKLALGFLGAEDFCRKARLTWRRGAFVFGKQGVGKSALSRAIALQLGFKHITIAAQEILDSSLLTRALLSLKTQTPAVVVIENLDQILKRVDAQAFLDLFDYVSERLEGVFWIATTRNAEDVPKNQIVRPGRFEESLRLGSPPNDVRKRFYETYLEPFMGDGLESTKSEHIALLESIPELSFAQLQEMRLLVAKVLMDGVPESLSSAFRVFAEEQAIAGDRSGGVAAALQDVGERMRLTDPRLLMSALHITDAFKIIVEATVGNASEALLSAQSEAKS